MVNRCSLTPAVCAACGAVFGFYFFSRIYHNGIISLTAFYLLLIIPLLVVCFFRVLALFPLCANVRAARIASRCVLACVAGLAVGVGAGGNALVRLDLGLPAERISGISGVLTEDPRIVSGGRAMAVLKLTEVSADRGLRARARGEMALLLPSESSARLKEFGRGSSIFSDGTIYQGGRGSLFIADSLHVTRPAPRLESFRTDVRNSLTGRFAARGGNWGALSLALLVGIRDNLDSSLSGLYRDAGCSYILALSGMHLAIIAALIAFALKRPLGQKAAAIAGAFLIVLYCLLAGPMPSLYRAALMYLIGVAAIVYFLKRDSLSLLAMAFIIQIIATPAAGNSISFILSYLALAGILSAGEALNYIFRGKIPALLSGPLSASLGAFLLTAGVCSYFFTALRAAGIVTGLILVPLTTVFMFGSIAWLLLDFITPWLSGLLSPVLSLLYDIMEKTVSLGACIPAVNGGFWPVLIVSLVLSAGIVCCALWVQAARNRIPSFN